jgi:hypothetical protein
MTTGSTREEKYINKVVVHKEMQTEKHLAGY